MDSRDPDALAQGLYDCYVLNTGYTPPESYADLVLFVGLSAVPVIFWRSPPFGFSGIQIGIFVHLNGSEKVSDRERMLSLAHEWAHALRARQRVEEPIRRNGGEGAIRDRDHEEQIALAFQRFF